MTAGPPLTYRQAEREANLLFYEVIAHLRLVTAQERARRVLERRIYPRRPR